MKTKLAIKLLTLLGFGSMFGGCDELHKIIDTPCEYGCPSAVYEVKGKVTDSDANPLKGIKVVVAPNEEGYRYSVDSLLTDAKGQYSIAIRYFPSNSVTFKVEASDVDGPEGGGEFATTEKSVEFLGSELSGGDGHWYQGKAAKTVDFALDKAK
ncbi:MAG: radical SAM-associated putative lipoprotein [Tidjanibacter sp.]|nr:radical SAM-associated putative lipoprotein [Tidjanibacter sp.]